MTYPNKKSNAVKTMIFVMIGSVLIIFTDLVILSGHKQIWPNGFQNSVKNTLTSFMQSDDSIVDAQALREQHARYMSDGIDDIELSDAQSPIVPAPIRIEREQSQQTQIASSLLSPTADQAENQTLNEIAPASGTVGNVLDEAVNKMVAPEKETTDILYNLGVTDEPLDTQTVSTPQKQPEYIYSAPQASGQVVIMIDDMGLGLRSKQVEVLPGPLTLAYLPYAKNLPARTARAKKNGHELMVHMPMEPMNRSLDGGPNVLSTNQSKSELIETLEWGLSQFDGYVGLNNHMGSRVTSDKDAMMVVMNHLKSKNIFFVDSKTIGSSVAAQSAREVGLPYAERDIFLDHEITIEFVRNALKKLEAKARKNGSAIAIGHPHAVTIQALKEWIPTLEDKGLTLVPASAVIKQPVAANDNFVASTQ